MKLNRFLLGILSVVFSLSFASAADIGVWHKDKAPPQVRAYDWGGFYIGPNLGGAIVDNGPSVTQSGSLSTLIPSSIGAKERGFMYGGQVGYGAQRGILYLGLNGTLRFGKFDADNASSSNVPRTLGPTTLAITSSSSSNSSSIKWLATVGPRVGLALDRVLFYVEPSFAWGKVEQSSAYNVTSIPTSGLGAALCAGGVISCPNSASGSNTSTTKTGFAIATGFDFAVAQNWTVGTNAMYFDLGNANLTYGNTTGAPTTVGYTSALHGWIWSIGANYKFNAL